MIRPEAIPQFDDDATRCPRCAKRIDASASACPACGFELIARHHRIRCVHCHNRIPDDATTCPRCGQDPRPRPISRVIRISALIALAVIIVACLGWVSYRALTTDVLARGLGLIEPSRVPTQIIQVIYVLATPVPPTRTLTPTATLVPTASSATTTPTRRGARAATPIPASPTNVPNYYTVPQLTTPLNMLIYNGSDAQVNLEWQAVSATGLRENEWYAITVSYTARDGKPVTQTRWTKEIHWTVPNTWWSDAAGDVRAFKWHVGVVRIEGIDPISSPSRVPVSPTSATRTFIWN